MEHPDIDVPRPPRSHRREAALFVVVLSAVAAGVFWIASRFTPGVPGLILAPAATAVAAAACLLASRYRGRGDDSGDNLPGLLRAEQVIRHAEEGILTIGARGQILTLNPAAEKLFGYHTAEVVNQPITVLIDEPAARDRPNVLRESLPSGSILGLAAGAREVIGKRKGGETFPLELTGSSMLLGEDAVSVAFVRDVSKRKRAQRYLIGHYAATCVLAEADSLSEAVPRVLRAVCEALQWDAGAYWRVDSSAGGGPCTEVYQSPAAGLPSRSDAGPLTFSPSQGLVGRVGSTGQPGWVEDLLGSPEDGRHAVTCGFPLHGTFAFPVRVGSEVGGVLIFFSRGKQKRDQQLLDIMAELGKQMDHFVARKRQEEALRETTQTLQSLVRAAPVAIHNVDLEGNVRLWNPAAERIFGWTEAEMLGRPLLLFSAGEPGDEVVTPPPGSGVPGGRGLPTRCKTKDGRVIDVSLSTAPLQNAGGTVFGVMGIAMDLTEQKSLEHQLHQAQKMEAVGQLAGGIAHDFNNLLTIITGYCELLRGEVEPGGPGEGFLDDVRQAGERAVELTRQLLAFSRKEIIQPRVLDLNAAVVNVQRMLGRVIGEDVRLETSLASTPSRVFADPGQVEQVLVNLAVNARDAMPTGGRLVVETSEVRVGEGGCPADPELSPGRYARLAVRDTGCGMDARTLTRVFEPFFTTKETGKGTGLGLATVYGIVKQSGGHVRATSVVGRGSTFEVYFPVVADAPAADASAPRPLPVRGGKETILLAEDEGALRGLTRRVLQSQGYTVLEASNGEEALRVVVESDKPPDLLLTDVVMPHVGGRLLAEAVTSRYPSATVLYMSGYTDDAVLRNGVLGSEMPFLQKPFRPDALLNKVREVLDRRSSNALGNRGVQPARERVTGHEPQAV